MNAAINLSTVGLALDIVGIIFLTNAMVVRKPRRFIQQYFGIEKPQPLRAVLDQLNAKAQIFTGFLALLVGFSLLIAAEVTLVEATAPVAPAPLAQRIQALLVLGFGILVVTVMLRLAQNAWAQRLLRRMLADFFVDHRDWNFEKHPQQTREMGELLRVPPMLEDSIGDYSDRVRTALKLAPPEGGQSAGPGRRGDDAFAPVRKVSAGRRS